MADSKKTERSETEEKTIATLLSDLKESSFSSLDSVADLKTAESTVTQGDSLPILRAMDQKLSEIIGLLSHQSRLVLQSTKEAQSFVKSMGRPSVSSPSKSATSFLKGRNTDSVVSDSRQQNSELKKGRKLVSKQKPETKSESVSTNVNFASTSESVASKSDNTSTSDTSESVASKLDQITNQSAINTEAPTLEKQSVETTGRPSVGRPSVGRPSVGWPSVADQTKTASLPPVNKASVRSKEKRAEKLQKRMTNAVEEEAEGQKENQVGLLDKLKAFSEAFKDKNDAQDAVGKAAGGGYYGALKEGLDFAGEIKEGVKNIKEKKDAYLEKKAAKKAEKEGDTTGTKGNEPIVKELQELRDERGRFIKKDQKPETQPPVPEKKHVAVEGAALAIEGTITEPETLETSTPEQGMRVETNAVREEKSTSIQGTVEASPSDTPPGMRDEQTSEVAENQSDDLIAINETLRNSEDENQDRHDALVKAINGIDGSGGGILDILSPKKGGMITALSAVAAPLSAVAGLAVPVVAAIAAIVALSAGVYLLTKGFSAWKDAQETKEKAEKNYTDEKKFVQDRVSQGVKEGTITPKQQKQMAELQQIDDQILSLSKNKSLPKNNTMVEALLKKKKDIQAKMFSEEQQTQGTLAGSEKEAHSIQQVTNTPVAQIVDENNRGLGQTVGNISRGRPSVEEGRPVHNSYQKSNELTQSVDSQIASTSREKSSKVIERIIEKSSPKEPFRKKDIPTQLDDTGLFLIQNSIL